jgi:hypothetical protein
MTTKELIIFQTKDVYTWTNKLIEPIAFEKWEIVPDVLSTSIQWQVGHLIMSHYFHTVMVIKGHERDVFSKIPLKEYSQCFTAGNAIDAIGKAKANVMMDQLTYMQNLSIQVIEQLDENKWFKELEPTPMPHPIAKNKFESLDWNIKHTMYHNGQLGILKRVLDKRHDFGLRIK